MKKKARGRPAIEGKRALTVRIQMALYDKLHEIAKKDRRTLSETIEILLEASVPSV